MLDETLLDAFHHTHTLLLVSFPVAILHCRLVNLQAVLRAVASLLPPLAALPPPELSSVMGLGGG